MSLLFAGCVALSLALTATACCTNYSYQIESLGVQFRLDSGLVPNLNYQDLLFAYDMKSHRAVINVTAHDLLTGQVVVETLYYEESEETAREYIVINNSVCVSLPTIVGPNVTNCVTGEAVYSNFTIGGQVNCSLIVNKQTGGSDSLNYTTVIATVVTDECVPFITANIYEGVNLTVGISSAAFSTGAYLQYNAKELQSTDILDVPKICTNSTSLEHSGLEEADLLLLHLMNDVGSLDVFTVLNRLAFLVTQHKKTA